MAQGGPGSFSHTGFVSEPKAQIVDQDKSRYVNKMATKSKIMMVLSRFLFFIGVIIEGRLKKKW